MFVDPETGAVQAFLLSCVPREDSQSAPTEGASILIWPVNNWKPTTAGLVLYRTGWTELTRVVETRIGRGGFNPLLNADMGWEYVLFNFMAMVVGSQLKRPASLVPFASHARRGSDTRATGHRLKAGATTHALWTAKPRSAS